MNDKKNVIWSTIGIACNVFISLFFLIIAARLNTVKDVGIFSFSFALANTMYVLGSFGGRVYQVTDSNGEFDDSEYVGFRYVSSVAMIVLTVIFIVVNRYDFYKSAIMVLLVAFKFIESISDAYFGVMQKNNKLYCVGKSMTAKAVLGITIFFVVDLLTKDLALSILSLVVVNLIIFILYDLKVVNKIKYVKPKFKMNTLINMFKVCFYFCAVMFLTSLVINFPRYAVDLYSTEEIQAVYGIIIMPATCIALFGQFILQPILVNLTNLHNEGDTEGFRSLINKAIVLLTVFTIICEIGAYIIGIPFLEIVYGMELKMYKFALLAVIFGALFSTIAAVLSVALTTMRVTKEQLYLYLINTIVAIIISIVFVKYLEFEGGILSYVCIMIFQFISYFILYKYKTIKGKKIK